MDKTNSATKGFAVLSAAGILNKVLSVVYVPFLLQILGGEFGYGIYYAGYQIYQFVYVLTNSGFPIGISKLQAELIAHGNYRDARRSFKIIRLSMALYGLVITIITAAFAGQITSAINYEKSYLVILALSPTMLFSAISCSYRGFFNGSSDMKPTAKSQIIEQFLNVTLSLVFALLLRPYGIEQACAGATVGTTIGALGSALFLGNTYKKKKHALMKKTSPDIKMLETPVILKRFLSYAVPIAFNSVIVFGGNLVDLWNTKQRLVAAGYSSDVSYTMYGVLSKYTQLLNVPLAITAAMYIAVMPSFSTAIALKDGKMLIYYINEAFRTSILIAIPAAVGLGVLSKPVFLLLFSQKYVDGWYLMAIGSVVIVLVAIVQIQSGILQAINKTRLSTISMAVGIIIKIFINYFLIAIPSVNIIGAVIGTIVCYIVAIYINSKYIQKFLTAETLVKKHIGRPIISSLSMGVAIAVVYKLLSLLLGFIPSMYIINAISALISIILGILVYGIVMLKTGGITSDDLNTIPGSSRLKKFVPEFILSMARTK